MAPGKPLTFPSVD